jgi:four helix bundle protein
MLRIYTVILEVLAELRPVVARIEMHDRDVGRQVRRAATSVALNCSEASGSNGGTRRERYRNALESARETGACLERRWRSGTSRTWTRRFWISWITCARCW